MQDILVDDAGCFTSGVGHGLAGLSVLGDGNTAVLERLSQQGTLLHQSDYAHRYTRTQTCNPRCVTFVEVGSSAIRAVWCVVLVVQA